MDDLRRGNMAFSINLYLSSYFRQFVPGIKCAIYDKITIYTASGNFQKYTAGRLTNNFRI